MMEKYNKLTVIANADRKLRADGFHYSQWICRCDCGNMVTIKSSAVKRGDTKSCGCTHQDANKGLPYGWILTRLKHRTMLRDQQISLSYDELLEFVAIKECHYCDAPIAWSAYSHRQHKSISQKCNLDRIDNAQGYSKNNCVVCCSACNYFRGKTFSYEEMIEFGPALKRVRMKREQRGIPWFECPILRNRHRV